MFKTILLATDGSDHATKAAAIAADLAARYDARLVIVTVLSRTMTLETVESTPQARRLSRASKAQIRKIHEYVAVGRKAGTEVEAFVPALPSLVNELGELILDDAEAIAARKKVERVTRVTGHGDVAGEILKQAEKLKADLIVMGTRGLSDLRGLLVGSISHKIIHHAKCPCLTVK